ncbi:MAG: hypothetical protein AAGH15_05225 [Myxococcota bacterium]
MASATPSVTIQVWRDGEQYVAAYDPLSLVVVADTMDEVISAMRTSIADAVVEILTALGTTVAEVAGEAVVANLETTEPGGSGDG